MPATTAPVRGGSNSAKLIFIHASLLGGPGMRDSRSAAASQRS
jgi:hypothetical protein